MKIKKKIIYFVISIVFVIVGYVLVSPENSIGCSILKLCAENYIGFSIGQPLFFSFIPISILFFIYLFIDEKRIESSYKLINYYFIISIILLYFVPTDCRAPLGLCTDKEMAAITLSVVFILLSIVKTVRRK